MYDASTRAQYLSDTQYIEKHRNGREIQTSEWYCRRPMWLHEGTRRDDTVKCEVTKQQSDIWLPKREVVVAITRVKRGMKKRKPMGMPAPIYT